MGTAIAFRAGLDRFSLRNLLIAPLLVVAFFVAAMVPGVARVQAQENARPLPESKDPRFTIEVIAQGLAFPWGLGFLPDGTILVTEREGQLRLIKNDLLVKTPVSNVPATFNEGQGGFFDVLADPNFAQNQLIYLSLAVGTAKSNATQIVKARLEGAVLRDVTPIFTSTRRATNAHFGGRLLFLPDETLLLVTGDGFEYREQAQRLDNSLGKIIRINTDGSIPADNPMASKGDVEGVIWTYGHRSPQGLARDLATGTVYMHEHGPQGGDEINVVTPGANYGWPVATYGIDYSGARISPFTSYGDTVQPIKYWVPSIAPSGLAVYRGNQFPEFDGDLFVGALAGRALHRIDMENGSVIGEEILLKALRSRIREVRVGPDGFIYLTTDSPSGSVLRLVPNR